MGLLGAIRAVEPTVLLQTILTKETDVFRSRYRFVIVQKGLQGALLFSATIVGVGACGSEILSLLPDFSFKSLRVVIRAVPHRIKPEFLDRFYRTIPERPSLAYRIERILSQALGIGVSLLGTLFLLAIRNDWVVQHHQNLRNFSLNAGRALPKIPQGQTPAVKTPTGATSTTSMASPIIVMSTAGNPANISKATSRPPIPLFITPANPSQITATATPSQSSATAISQKAPSLASIATPQKASSPSSTDIPLPPPPPSFIAAASNPLTGVKADLTSAILTTQADIKKNNSTKQKAAPRKKQNLNTMGRAMARMSRNLRKSESQAITVDLATGTYTISAQKITLNEIKDEAGIEFTDPSGKELKEDDLDQSLGDYIYTNCDGTPAEGTQFAFQGFNIKIIKVNARDEISQVEISYTE